jgi:penicillin-binding protein 1A
MHSRRQPGSGFKPFIYYQAFKQLGFHPGTVITDRPVRISIKGAPDWEPENFNRKYSGNMILKHALTHSVNTISAQLIEMTGPEKVASTAGICGITSPLESIYSLALGTCLVTPLEMAAAFSTFATLGIRHDPFLIWRVEDPFGRVIYEHIVQEKQVLEPAIAYQIVDMMQSVIDQGSGQSIRRSGFKRTAAGKTGTSDHYNDAWFTGFTPTLCTSVWTGFDKGKNLMDTRGVGITGGRSAAPIWARFMENALKGQPERHFPIPDDIRFESANAVTGCPAEDLQEENVSQTRPALIMTVPLKSDQSLCTGKKEIQ